MIRIARSLDSIRKKNAYVLLEEQGTRPQVHYYN